MTGFGFLGHLSEMLAASTAGAVVRRDEVPVWENAERLGADGCYPGGLVDNREHLTQRVRVEAGLDEDDLLQEQTAAPRYVARVVACLDAAGKALGLVRRKIGKRLLQVPWSKLRRSAGFWEYLVSLMRVR